MAAWLDALVAAERDNQPAVLVTVLAAKGSTPREAGAKMAVSADGLAGTIGGGNLEHQCEATARDLLAAGAEGPSTRDFPLGPALGQCCGGHVTVLFEVLRPPTLQIGLFGAGHVGKALVKLLADLPCRVTWIDSRPEALKANLPPNVIPVRSAQPVQAVGALAPGTLVLVMTHDHQLDFDIVVAALGRPDLPAVGLIGSDTKRARFVSRLQRLGITAERLICPIGLPGIEGKEPAVVAVSVAAQILQLQPHVPKRPLVSQRSAPAMPTPALPTMERSCGDCVCPPVIASQERS
jgi:xanthine dehydrogenase accessory factor